MTIVYVAAAAFVLMACILLLIDSRRRVKQVAAMRQRLEQSRPRPRSNFDRYNVDRILENRSERWN